MEEEEIALKKQLEASKDFEERKEIRQKLRKLRQQKLEALEAEPTGRGGRRRREERTERTTTTTSDGVTTTEKRTTKTEIVENGDVIKSEEDVVVKKEELEPEPEPEPEPEAEPEPEVEAEAEPEVEQEPEKEEEQPEEDQEDGDVPFYLKKNPEDLTENDIGEIDDLDFLENTLKDLPLKFFEVRKHLRGQIRKVKVNRGTSSRHTLGNVAQLKKRAFEEDKKSQSISRQEKGRDGKSSVLERTSKFGERTRAKRNEDIESSRIEKTDGKHKTHIKENGELKREKEDTEKSGTRGKSEENDHKEEYTIEKLASDTLLKRLDEPIEIENTEKEPKDIDSEDDASTISSRSATSSTSDIENAPPPSSDAKEKSGATAAVAPAHRIDGLQPGLQAKKTDFRSQLKKTGINPKMNIAVTGKISSLAKKDTQEPKLDLRRNLKSVPGAVPLTRRGSGSEKYGPSLRDRPKKDEVDTAEKEPTEGKRRISSADLFNLINKPKDTESKDTDYSKQRGIAKKPVAPSYKYEPPKIVGEEDESFKVLMSQRKKEVKRQHTPADLKPGIRLSNKTSRNKPEWSARQLQKPQIISPKTALQDDDDVEEDLPPDIPDNQIDEILKDVDVEEIEVEKLPRKLSAPSIVAPISPRRNRKLSSGNIKWVEGPQIDIQDKSQLSLLRQQLEEQKRRKEAGGGTTITEEKTSITDGGSTTTTTKTTEKHGPGGSTTFTKTTTTRSGGTGRAGARSIEAELAKKKKERMQAKAAAFKNVKDQRNAFKEKLEAQNPKSAGTKKTFQSPNTAVNALLEWCRRKTRGYGIDLQNYTTSWADGMAMCAIFHYFSPDLIPFETLDPNDRKRNWTLAFDAAYAEGLDPILELEDVLRSKVPEPKSLITYVHTIYQHFHDKAEKAKLEMEQAA
ncbi:microtubule-associated protein 1B-like [Actinia tenebrosa]|uniref:Microtubule-associated protein 1B-like n=1 Tax=Actinia tenebrosa TaxID=6105 RepID=A0A6P8IAZ9_ACTTE|nr:microtubule-associated protein 1B-like [Actinia tenebrosa]